MVALVGRNPLWGGCETACAPVFLGLVRAAAIAGSRIERRESHAGRDRKTPVVILLVEWLLAQGKRVAILSRGYRRTSRDEYLLVSNGERLLVGPDEAGDEPFLMAQRCPKAIVAVGADRYELGYWVLDRFPIDCLVLDDGFQHLGLYRDVNLLLVDATDVEGSRLWCRPADSGNRFRLHRAPPQS